MCVRRIDLILELLYQSWVYYVINSSCNWTCFGVVRSLWVTSPSFQQALLCLIGFMVCLNWSSPEDNRSLQCFKLNYRCGKVCSENDCKEGLLSPRQFWWGSHACPSYQRVAGDRQGVLKPGRRSGCRPRGRSSPCPARGEARAVLSRLQLLRGVRLPGLSSTQRFCPRFKNHTAFPSSWFCKKSRARSARVPVRH